MGSAEEELEEQLLDVGKRILAPPSSVDELLLLLDQAETFLSRVEQSPSQSMLAALHSAKSGLTAKEFLGHSDTDVKVAVASCISEITRITAPEAPYDDDLMKEVFAMIVEAFRELDDISSRSHLKRVSILETVAKVRSCVVMLDLECDCLILKMFHHFLNTIRDNHPENVFSSMEMIMSLVLEESEDISSDLVSCLLLSVKKNNKGILPIARALAEKVIGNCASKLKPSLMEAIQSTGASSDDYSKIVASACLGRSDVLEQNDVNVSGECLAGESKMSERAVSDIMPQTCSGQGSQKEELEVACPEVSAAADKLPRSLVSNGTALTGNDSAFAEPSSPSKKTEHSCHSTPPKNGSAARLDSEKLDASLDLGIKKSRGRKSSSAVQPTENTSHSQLEAVELPNRRKGRGRKLKTLQSGGPSEKEAEATKIEDDEKRTEHHVASEKPTDNSGSVISATDIEKLPDSRRPKRGRSSGSKVSTKKLGTSPAGDAPVSLSGSKKFRANGNTEDEAVPSMDIVTKEQTEGNSGSEKKPLRYSGKKRHLGNEDNGGKSSTNSHTDIATDVTAVPEEKVHRRRGRKPKIKKINEGEASGKVRAAKTKQQKGGGTSENIVVDEPNKKGMVSSTKVTSITKSNKDQKLSEESHKMKSRKKRAREEISENPPDAIKYDEHLVGVNINVWWPDDEQFYPGVITSYDPATMRHKVSYVDGDEEVLLLKDETFEIPTGEKQEDARDDSTPQAAETPRKKAKRSDSSVKKSKVVSSSKSGGSTGKVSADRTKSGRKRQADSAETSGGRRGGSSKTVDNHLTGSISKKNKGRRYNNVEALKSNILSEDELDNKTKDGSPRPTTKANDSITKPGRKSKSYTHRTGSGSKDDAAKLGSAKNQTPTPGSKAKEDVAGTGSKSKPKITSPGKSRSKSDANGSAKVKTGPSIEPETESISTEVNLNIHVAQENEEKRGKKRRKKSQNLTSSEMDH